MLRDLKDSWLEHFEGKLSYETINSFNELAYCQYLGASIEALCEDVWEYIMFLADSGREQEARKASDEVQDQIEKICGKILSNTDAISQIVRYVDDLEDGVYWAQVFERIERDRKEEN